MRIGPFKFFEKKQTDQDILDLIGSSVSTSAGVSISSESALQVVAARPSSLMHVAFMSHGFSGTVEKRAEIHGNWLQHEKRSASQRCIESEVLSII